MSRKMVTRSSAQSSLTQTPPKRDRSNPREPMCNILQNIVDSEDLMYFTHLKDYMKTQYFRSLSPTTQDFFRTQNRIIDIAHSTLIDNFERLTLDKRSIITQYKAAPEYPENYEEGFLDYELLLPFFNRGIDYLPYTFKTHLIETSRRDGERVSVFKKMFDVMKEKTPLLFETINSIEGLSPTTSGYIFSGITYNIISSNIISNWLMDSPFEKELLFRSFSFDVRVSLKFAGPRNSNDDKEFGNLIETIQNIDPMSFSTALNNAESNRQNTLDIESRLGELKATDARRISDLEAQLVITRMKEMVQVKVIIYMEYENIQQPYISYDNSWETEVLYNPATYIPTGKKCICVNSNIIYLFIEVVKIKNNELTDVKLRDVIKQSGISGTLKRTKTAEGMSKTTKRKKHSKNKRRKLIK